MTDPLTGTQPPAVATRLFPVYLWPAHGSGLWFAEAATLYCRCGLGTSEGEALADVAAGLAEEVRLGTVPQPATKPPPGATLRWVEVPTSP